MKHDQATRNAIELVQRLDAIRSNPAIPATVRGELSSLRVRLAHALDLFTCDGCGELMSADDALDLTEIALCGTCCRRDGIRGPRCGPSATCDDTPAFMRDLPVELD